MQRPDLLLSIVRLEILKRDSLYHEPSIHSLGAIYWEISLLLSQILRDSNHHLLIGAWTRLGGLWIDHLNILVIITLKVDLDAALPLVS